MITHYPLKKVHKHRYSRGFSILEALFALVISLVGFTAIFKLQGAQTSAAISARDLSSASNLIEWGVSTLTRDSFAWTGLVIPGPRLNADPDVWHALTEFPVDQNGQSHRDDDPDQGTQIWRQRFCVHYWLSPMGGLYEGLLNGRLRVVWRRDPLDQTSIYRACGEANASAFEMDPIEWFSITVPFVLRRHP